MENLPISFGSWIASFVFLVFIRNFLETLSSGNNFLSINHWTFFFLHSISSYLAVFLIFILTIHFITGERVEKVSRASIWLALWLLLAPILDKIIFGGKYVSIKYIQLQANGLGDMFKEFYNITLFGPNGLLQFAHKFWGWGDGIFFNDIFSHSFGLKIELGIIIFSAMIYVFLKTKSAWKTFIFLLVARLVMSILESLPFLITIFLGLPNGSLSFHDVSRLNPEFSWNLILFSLYFLLIIISAIIWFWRYDKDKFIALAKNVRPARLALYLGVFYYGIYLAAPNFKFNFFDTLLIIIASLSIVFSWLFAVGSNDLADEEGDAISKSYRPLPSGKLTRTEVKNLNLIFRVVSYLLALVAGYAFFITILIRSAVSYLYSNYPFRLKRFPIVSTFCIACGVTLGTLGGYLLFSQKTIFDFPTILTLFLLTFFTLGMNFIHINDREGDKKEGVWTIPVIFGETKGKTIVALCLFAAFLSTLFFYPLMPAYLFVTILMMSSIGFWVVNKKKFREWQVFLVCAVFAIIFILFFERPLWPLLWK